MSLQIACIKGGIVTLAAFVRLFSTVFFSSEPSNFMPGTMQSHIGCIHKTSSLCVFKYVLKWPALSYVPRPGQEKLRSLLLLI